MKIPCEVTIPTGPYANIKPQIVVDTDNYEEARALIGELYMNFGNMLEGFNGENLGQINYKLQELTDNAREGKASDIRDYQEVVEKVPGAAQKINEAKKAHNREVYKNKHTKQAESELDHALDLQHEMDTESANK